MSYGAQHEFTRRIASHRICAVPPRACEIKPTLRFLAEDGRRLEACTHVHACPWTGRPGTHHTRLQGFLQGCSRASFRAFLSCPRRSQAAAGWGAPRGQPGQSAAVSAMLLVLIASCSLASPPASIDFESPRISLLPTRRTVSSPSLCLSRCSCLPICLRCSLGFIDPSGGRQIWIAAVLARITLRSHKTQFQLEASLWTGQDSEPRPGSRFRAPQGSRLSKPAWLSSLDSHAAKSLQVQSSPAHAHQMLANLVA
ncbi:hypothetical protein HDV62DRAFT_318873 [Trichoderma sp. SZMC 28011]